ncbi:hypothetical protein ACIBD9_30285 [Micromonospora sp. NPDC050784]|uniref:hypothetical protein n=1 Tax=Micromonospora sp. NPDC050784 TaxID=3364281 RepID=UPI00379C53BF
MLSIYVSLSARLARAELGDVATWVGAFANVATLAFALVAALVAFRVYKIESGRDRRAEDERRERALDEKRQQASLVSVWLAQQEGVVNVVAPSDTFQPLLRSRPTWGAYVLNASNVPVYHVIVLYRWADKPDRLAAGYEIRVVPPHQDGVWTPLPEQIRRKAEADFDLEYAIDVAVEFRDSAGRWWRRDWDGFLAEAPDRPA